MKRFLQAIAAIFLPAHWTATKKQLNGNATRHALNSVHSGAITDTGRVFPR